MVYLSQMAQGAEKPIFEQPAAMPEGAIESPEAGTGFETPAAPAAERPSEPTPTLPAPAAPAAAALRKDAAMLQVEDVLEEGMREVYASLDDAHRKRFKAEGEKVAIRLAEMVRGAKSRAREILLLLTAWLKIIPGVNRYYLEQEAKLKADKILALIESEKGKRGL